MGAGGLKVKLQDILDVLLGSAMSSLRPVMIVLISDPRQGQSARLVPSKRKIKCNNFASWRSFEPNDRLCQGLAVAGIGICDEECIILH